MENEKPSAVTRVVLGLAIASVVGLSLCGGFMCTANVLADDGALWNFEKVLGKGRGNFKKLCTAEGGSVEKVNAETVACVRGSDAKPTVGSAFKNGRSYMFVTVWEPASSGLAPLALLRESFGDADAVENEGGCTHHWWVNPEGRGRLMLMAMCSADAKFLVSNVE